MRSEFCIDCIQAIDTRAESRISTVGDWVKFVDLKMDQIDNIDPTKRSEKEKRFWKSCSRKVDREVYFLGIKIGRRRLQEIEKDVPIEK